MPSVSPNTRLRAPPGVVNQVSPAAGAATAPATGRPSSIRPMLTVKCASPRTKALVPSSGSTSMNRRAMLKGTPPAAESSSAITGMSGNSALSRSRISASPRRSASVTGLSSLLTSTVRPERHSGRMTALAASTMSAKAAPGFAVMGACLA